MDRLARKRIAIILSAFALIVGLFAFRLLRLSGGTTETEVANARDTLTYQTVAVAARGEIFDRNGKLLVTNRPSYDVAVINFVFYGGSDPNGTLRELSELFAENNVPVIDHLPLSKTAPFILTDDQSEAWMNYYHSFLTERGWDSEISATTLMQLLRKRYHIPESWDDTTARAVIGARYELDLRSFAPVDNYIMAKDIPVTLAATIREKSYCGVSVEVGAVREYASPYAAHILGHTGLMDAEEWATYKDVGYAMNAQVGKDGVEKAFEPYLHGQDGTQLTTVMRTSGAKLSSEFGEVPIAGNHVYLSIDLDLQKAAEDALEATILDLRENGTGRHKEGKDAQGGAVVALDCKTGETLVSASYPTFRLDNYAEMQTAENSPLWNRALLAAYAPGSVYKPVTAIAAIDRGGIGRYRTIFDAGKYTYYENQGYVCFCHIYTSQGITHGTINMMQALSVSCNYYFYEVGREVGIGAIDDVAASLGLGEPTGIELPEAINTRRANPETKKDLYEEGHNDWYGADTLQASIGQSDNLFTPMQLAQYCATLANGGKRMKTTLLSHVESWDHSSVLETNTPVVLSETELSDDAIDCIREGMVMSATEGTAATFLADAPYSVAAKTGTAQHGSGGSDNASFICFAPADDPQIAICVFVEKGAQGGNLGRVARAILDEYFDVNETE